MSNYHIETIITDIISEVIYKLGEKDVIKIQSRVRGNLCRKDLRKLKDKWSFKNTCIMLYLFIIYTKVLSLIDAPIRNPPFPSEISENIVKFAIFNRSKVMASHCCSGDLKLLDYKTEVKARSSEGPASFGPQESWRKIYFMDARRFSEGVFSIIQVNLKNDSKEWRDIVISGEAFDTSQLDSHSSELTLGNLDKKNKKDLIVLCKKYGHIKQKYKGSNKTNQQLIDMLMTQKYGSAYGPVKTMGDLCDTGRGGTRPHICTDKLLGQISPEYKKEIFNGHISEINPNNSIFTGVEGIVQTIINWINSHIKFIREI